MKKTITSLLIAAIVVVWLLISYRMGYKAGSAQVSVHQDPPSMVAVDHDGTMYSRSYIQDSGWSSWRPVSQSSNISVHGNGNDISVQQNVAGDYVNGNSIIYNGDTTLLNNDINTSTTTQKGRH